MSKKLTEYLQELGTEDMEMLANERRVLEDYFPATESLPAEDHTEGAPKVKIFRLGEKGHNDSQMIVAEIHQHESENGRTLLSTYSIGDSVYGVFR